MRYIDPCLLRVSPLSNSQIVSCTVQAMRNVIHRTAEIETVVPPPFQISISYAGETIFPSGTLQGISYTACGTYRARYKQAMPTQSNPTPVVGVDYAIVTNKMIRTRILEVLNLLATSAHVSPPDPLTYISLPEGSIYSDGKTLRYKVFALDFRSGLEVPGHPKFTDPAYPTFVARTPPYTYRDAVGIVVWGEASDGRNPPIRTATAIFAMDALSNGYIVGNFTSFHARCISASVETASDIFAIVGVDVFDPNPAQIDGVHTIPAGTTYADLARRYTAYTVLGYDEENRKINITYQDHITRTFTISPSVVFAYDFSGKQVQHLNITRTTFTSYGVYVNVYMVGRDGNSMPLGYTGAGGYASVATESVNAGGYSSVDESHLDSSASGFLLNEVYKDMRSLAKQESFDNTSSGRLRTILIPSLQPYTKVSFNGQEYTVVSFTHSISSEGAFTDMEVV